MEENAAHDDCFAMERNLFSSPTKAQDPEGEIAFRIFKISETTENI